MSVCARGNGLIVIRKLIQWFDDFSVFLLMENDEYCVKWWTCVIQPRFDPCRWINLASFFISCAPRVTFWYVLMWIWVGILYMISAWAYLDRFNPGRWLQFDGDEPKSTPGPVDRASGPIGPTILLQPPPPTVLHWCLLFDPFFFIGFFFCVI